MRFGGVKQLGTGRGVGGDWLDAYVEGKSACIRH
jgi:acyl-CoA reductase-like NAD-dependent aldehyde dehydrogenase